MRLFVGNRIFTAFYLVLGGYVASAKVDFIQGIIMIIGVILMLTYIISHRMWVDSQMFIIIETN